jgi:ADP-ribose pyrophosphatase
MTHDADILLTTRKLRVERRRITTPRGQEFQRIVIVHPGAVVILPLLDADTVVMIRNYRPATGETLLELPAGTLEADETPAACAARELIEETGYCASRLEPLMSFYTSPGVLSERMHAFVARDLTHVGQQLADGEEIDVEPVRVDRIRQLLTAGELRDGKTIAVIGTYLLQRDGRKEQGCPTASAVGD